MVKSETFDHLHLVYHFTVALIPHTTYDETVIFHVQ